MSRFLAWSLVVLVSAVFVGCNTSGTKSPCPACGAHLVCDVDSGKCVPAAQACGANTQQGVNACVCKSGYFDCNDDLGQSGGNGCECTGGCNGAACAGGCQPTVENACGGSSNYCSANGACNACAVGSFNCDGINDCESSTACAQCDASIANECGGMGMYCDGVSCQSCPSGSYNCDGLAACEANAPCGTTCSASVVNDCGTPGTYCQGQSCVACPTGMQNCDGLADCETAGPCSGCTPLVWSTASQSADYLDLGGGVVVTYAELLASTSAPFDMLRIEDFHLSAGYPKTVTYSANSNTTDCEVCITLAFGCTSDFASCDRIFFPQEGSVTLTQADEAVTGVMSGSVRNLTLVEWDEANDRPVPAGTCYEIDQLSLEASW